MAAMAQAPVIAVRGEVDREVDPEIARFTVTVSARDRDRQDTLRLLTGRLDEVRRVLDGYAAAIEHRETSSVTVYPERKGGGERVARYAGSVTTTVTVNDFTVLGELMLRLGDLDQVSVNGPWWQLRPDSTAYASARQEAIHAAVARAREYAAAVGSRLTTLVELADSGLPETMPVTRSMHPMAFGGAPGGAGGLPQLDLEPARQRVHAEVIARFLATEPSSLATEPTVLAG